MSKLITIFEAYKSMFTFLEEIYFNKNKPESLGDFLSDNQLLQDGKPFDPAAWFDWVEKIKLVLKEENANIDFEIENERISTNQTTITVIQAYKTMLEYLNELSQRYTESENLRTIMDDLSLLKNGKTNNLDMWDKWVETIDRLLCKKEEYFSKSFSDIE